MNQLTNPMDQKKIASPHKGRRIVWSILATVVIYYVVLGIGVYSGSWQGSRTQRLLKYTPLPVASVGWRPLSYADLLKENSAIKHYTTYLKTSAAEVYQPPAEDSAVTALTKLIRQAAAERVAKKLGVSVSSADVEQAYQSQLLQSGNAEQVAAAIKDYYGWTPEEFQARVIKPAVLRNKLQEKLSFDESISASTKEQAEKVLVIVKDGKESFSDLAKRYSDDVYGANGGDLGFVSQGEQVQEIDEAAFGLELNAVSDLIHTKYGYHIIKVTERKTVDGQEQAHLMMMTFLAPQVDPYLNDALKTIRVMVLYRHLKWNAETYRVSTNEIVPVTNTNSVITNNAANANSPVNQ